MGCAWLVPSVAAGVAPARLRRKELCQKTQPRLTARAHRPTAPAKEIRPPRVYLLYAMVRRMMFLHD